MRYAARSVARELGITAVMLIAACFATWPLAGHMGSHVPGDLGDPLENAWIFGWGSHAVLEQPRALFHANMFFPSRFSLAFAENMLGLSIPAAPLVWVTDNPVLAVNVATLLIFAVSGWSVFQLTSALSGRRDAALIASLAFVVLPYRVAAVAHVHVVAIHLLPLALLCVVWMARSSRWRWQHTTTLALVVGAQLWASLTGGMLTLAAVGLAAVWAVGVRRRSSLAVVGGVLAAIAGALLLASPVLLAYAHARAQNPEYGHPDVEVVQNSATFGSYAFPPQGGTLADDVYDDLADAFRPFYTPQEKTLFPGIVLSTAGVASLVASLWMFVRRQGPLAALAFSWLLAGGGFVLSLGPRLGASDDGLPLPFAVVSAIVPGGLTRVPARFGVLFLLGLICAAAVVLGELLTRLPQRPRLAVVALFTVLLATESWPSQVYMTMAPRRTPAHAMLARSDRTVVALPTLEYTDTGALVFPSVPREATHLWYSTANFRPLLNGYGAFLPAPYTEAARVMQELPSHRSLGYLRAIGVDTILVETDLLPGSRWSGVTEALAAWPGVELLAQSASTQVWDISRAQTT